MLMWASLFSPYIGYFFYSKHSCKRYLILSVSFLDFVPLTELFSDIVRIVCDMSASEWKVAVTIWFTQKLTISTNFLYDTHMKLKFRLSNVTLSVRWHTQLVRIACLSMYFAFRWCSILIPKLDDYSSSDRHVRRTWKGNEYCWPPKFGVRGVNSTQLYEMYYEYKHRLYEKFIRTYIYVNKSYVII